MAPVLDTQARPNVAAEPIHTLPNCPLLTAAFSMNFCSMCNMPQASLLLRVGK